MKISELAARTGLTTSAIRYYESQGLLAPAQRAANGYRVYAEDSVSRLDFIARAQTAGLKLVDIIDVLALRDAGQSPCHHVLDLLAAKRSEIAERMRELEALRTTLDELAEVAAGGKPDADDSSVCWILEAPRRSADAGRTS